MSNDSNSQSEAVWISGKPRTHSFDLGASSGAAAAPYGSSPFQSRFGFARSWSVNSEGASTTTSSTSNSSSGYESTSSPPRSPIDGGNSGKYSNYNSKAMNIPSSDPMAAPGGGRSRTSSFSSGYGASFDHDSDQKSSKKAGGFFSEPDPYLIHSPLSSSAPQGNLFRRSNSISVGAVDYGSPGAKYLSGSPRNLGPIDELGKVHHFGDAFKKSVSALFNAPKMPPQMQRQRSLGSNNVPEQRKKTQMTDRVVSLLCENAIR